MQSGVCCNYFRFHSGRFELSDAAATDVVHTVRRVRALRYATVATQVVRSCRFRNRIHSPVDRRHHLAQRRSTPRGLLVVLVARLSFLN